MTNFYIIEKTTKNINLYRFLSISDNFDVSIFSYINVFTKSFEGFGMIA